MVLPQGKNYFTPDLMCYKQHKSSVGAEKDSLWNEESSRSSIMDLSPSEEQISKSLLSTMVGSITKSAFAGTERQPVEQYHQNILWGRASFKNRFS